MSVYDDQLTIYEDNSRLQRRLLLVYKDLLFQNFFWYSLLFSELIASLSKSKQKKSKWCRMMIWIHNSLKRWLNSVGVFLVGYVVHVICVNVITGRQWSVCGSKIAAYIERDQPLCRKTSMSLELLAKSIVIYIVYVIECAHDMTRNVIEFVFFLMTVLAVHECP